MGKPIATGMINANYYLSINNKWLWKYNIEQDTKIRKIYNQYVKGILICTEIVFR